MRAARSSFFPLREGRLTGRRLAILEVRRYRFSPAAGGRMTILCRTGNPRVTLGLPNLGLLSDTYRPADSIPTILQLTTNI